MKYDFLLFDADDTLLDFKKSEEASFFHILTKHEIEGDRKTFHNSYKQINEDLWSRHALGHVSKDVLKVERFERFLNLHGLKGDPMAMSEDYLSTLPTHVYLIDGALDLLQFLHKKIPTIIVTNGIGHVQHQRLANSGLKPFIDLMVVSEECGYSKPDERIFFHTFDLIKASPKKHRLLMIGDKLETDILGASKVGIDSCWFNPDRVENTTTIQPKFEISDLSKLKEIL